MAHAKKRRPEEQEEMHLAFRGAANALSHVYTQAVAHQKASFLAGERHAMENVYQWISSQHEEASKVSVADVVAFLEDAIEHGAEDMPVSPQYQFPNQHPQPVSNFASANVQNSSFSFANVAAALNPRMSQTDQTRSAGFLNTLPSPSRQNSDSHHLVPCPGYGPSNLLPNGAGARNNYCPQIQEFRYPNSFYFSMDSHDTP